MHPAGDLLDSPVFRPMKTFVPLQAADIVAYELHKEAYRQYFRPNEKARWGFTELQDIVKLIASGFNPLIIKRNESVIETHMKEAQRRINDAILGKPNPYEKED